MNLRVGVPGYTQGQQELKLFKDSRRARRQAREPRGLTLEIPGVQILHTDKPTLPTVFNETFEDLRL